MVSLVPSLTEALVSVEPDAVVGATDWCTHPPDLDERGVTRVRGTKNPDLAAIRALRPDLVVANKEENRELDVRRLRESGVPVWVTDIETVPDSVASMERLLDALGWSRPAWLAEARELWCGPLPPVTRTRRRTDLARPVDGRRRPHVHHRPAAPARLGQRLRRATPTATRRVDLADLDAAGADVVLLPDEPYVFTADDGPEAFTRTPTELVSGRLLTWYGPSLVEAATLR